MREKELLIDAGAVEVYRYEGESIVPASYRDISDLVAAYFNLNSFEAEWGKES